MPLRAVRDIEFPERGGGYLDIERLSPQLPDLASLWIVNSLAVYEGGERLGNPRVAATQLSMESDRSFASFEEALAHVRQPKPAGSANLVWSQVLFDVLLEYPIRSELSAFSIRPALQGLADHVVTVLRFVAPTGLVRAYALEGDPGVVPLDPRWSQAAVRFVRLGFLHILDGTDHLLFLLCLVIPFRKLRPLIWVVTAFTAAHSLTLIASAFQFAPDALWFPPLIETLIAASIVWMAFENIAGNNKAERRWMMAFGFGLVHGFGFSFALRETLQFAGEHLVTSLLAFNVGVELGQLLVLAILIPALGFLFRFVVAERIGTILISAFVAHTAWHWSVQRWEQLRKFQFEWPSIDSATLAGAMRWGMLVVVASGLAWASMRIRARYTR